MSAVLVVVIDCTLTGASPPTSTQPTFSFLDFRRSASELISTILPAGAEPTLLAYHVEDDRAVLRLVELQEEEPLPLPEHRLSRRHRDRMRRRPQQHMGDVGLSIRPLVALLQVL